MNCAHSTLSTIKLIIGTATSGPPPLMVEGLGLRLYGDVRLSAGRQIESDGISGRQ